MLTQDPLTLASAIFSVLGLGGLFVSSKPLTVGGVLMTAALAASMTQAAIGVSRSLQHAPSGVQPHDAATDMTDLLQWAREWVWSQALLLRATQPNAEA